MLRWAIRAIAASKYKSKVISESSRASRKSKDAMSSFVRNDLEGKNAVRMVPRGGIEPPTQGFSEYCFTKSHCK